MKLSVVIITVISVTLTSASSSAAPEKRVLAPAPTPRVTRAPHTPEAPLTATLRQKSADIVVCQDLLSSASTSDVENEASGPEGYTDAGSILCKVVEEVEGELADFGCQDQCNEADTYEIASSDEEEPEEEAEELVQEVEPEAEDICDESD